MEDQQRDPGVIVDVARDRLARQLAAADSLDSRGGVVFGVGSALVGILAGIVTLKPVPNWEAAFGLCGGIAAYLVLTFTVLYAFLPRRWKDGPTELEVAADWGQSQDHKVAMRVARTLAQAIECNAEHVDRKVNGLRISLACLVALTVFLVVLAWFASPTLPHG